MSRSTRKPYASVCGVVSNKSARIYASRCVRRAHKAQIDKAIREDELDCLLLYDRKECSENDPWGWPSDGKNRFEPKYNKRYEERVSDYFGLPESDWRHKWYLYYLNELECGPDCYWRKIQRK